MDATVKKDSPGLSVDTWALALRRRRGGLDHAGARTRQDTRMMKQHINQLKDHLKQALPGENSRGHEKC